MQFKHWLQHLLSRIGLWYGEAQEECRRLYGRSAREKTRPAGRWARLRIECLEMRITPSYSLTDLASFNGTNGGATPSGGLVEDSSGNLFGTTEGGGTSGAGTVFEWVKSSGTISVLANFNGTNGANPYGGLIEDSSGNLFGTTEGGGTSGAGTVFEWVKSSGTISVLANFNGTNGANPYGGLIEDSSGNLFGTTYEGGTSSAGTVFEWVKSSGMISVLANFNGTNGSNPYAGLIEDSSGDLFGTTEFGGPSFAGSVFEWVKSSGTISVLANFNGTNGELPYAGLIEDSSGNLFGTTANGGANGGGTVFEWVKSSGTISVLANFNGTNGANPYGGLIEDSSGNLFGTTEGAEPAAMTPQAMARCLNGSRAAARFPSSPTSTTTPTGRTPMPD